MAKRLEINGFRSFLFFEFILRKKKPTDLIYGFLWLLLVEDCGQKDNKWLKPFMSFETS